ncbi:MAG: glycosyltransferase family 2 protein [Candidatus Rokubacteria bacterium]|nr:glycosyltransferase family 2 protein [Candidatus Rokubacteria bacterium]
MEPCVSVVIPVYNAGPYVATAARSALGQPEALDVVLVEDGSVDQSLEVCRRLAASDARITLVRHPDGRNHGDAASRNAGVRAARGRYVAFLDADDRYLPNRFAVSVPILESRPDVDGVWDAVAVEFEDGSARAEWADEPHAGTLLTLGASVAPDQVLTRLLEGTRAFHIDGVVVRRDVFAGVGFFDETLRVGSDTAMWWKIAAAHRLVAGSAATPVAIYRRRRGSLASAATPEYADEPVRVALTVWRWARTQGLPPVVRDRVAMAAIHRVLSAAPGVVGWRAVASRFRRLVRTLVAAPELLAHPALWIRVVRTRVSAKLRP